MGEPARGEGLAALSAIVLAAGSSRRMGGPNKLLLPVGDEPLVRRTTRIVAALPLAEVVVVTGHQASAVGAALEGLAVRLAHNPRHEEGQMTSVRAGLEALARPSAGVLVCLADQPALTPDDLRLVARAFLERAGCAVLVPTYAGARGNPIVLARQSIADILARGGQFGCKHFVERNADLVTTFAMPNDHVLVDVDRPDDYRALAGR